MSEWPVILWTLVKYVLVTLAGLTTARVLMHFVLGSIRRPNKPEKQNLAECAAESLHMATELRMNATALFNQYAGKVHPR